MNPSFDIIFLGHYTKDTIVSSQGTRIVDGGAFNYGSHATIRMGLKVAAVTRLAQEDFRVIDELRDLGVHVFAKATPCSTCLRLEYPSSNPDKRVIYMTSSAGPFTPSEVVAVSAKAFVIGASARGEVPIEVIRELRKKETLISVDLQGFIRVVRGGKLIFEPWPEKESVLSMVDVLKTDAVEAELLTGEKNIRVAAKKNADWGPREVVLTHQEGILVYDGDAFYQADFYPKKLVGRSGRGDTCIASYVARRLNEPPSEAILWAAALTSMKMEAEGPFRRDVREVEELIQEKYRLAKQSLSS
jgi:sugar/nucleoside kinase (ribokinase family)